MLVLALLLCPLVSHAQTTVRLAGTPDVAEWIAARFAKGKQPPFSFVYNGIPSSEFLTRWQAPIRRPYASAIFTPTRPPG